MRSKVVCVFILICICCVQGKGGGRGGGGRGGGRGSSSRGGSRGSSGGGGSYGKSGFRLPGFWKTPLKAPNRPAMVSKSYGSTFGYRQIGGNTYIRNGYYGGGAFGTPFLVNALFFRMGMGMGAHHWNDYDDRKWRATTQAPYFENKVPGSDDTLPAAAVRGAATAFGLSSLLPLNVPSNEPLMYCNSLELSQDQIQLNNIIYSCDHENFVTTCSANIENLAEVECKNGVLQCDLGIISNDVHCSNSTLYATIDIVCNSTFGSHDYISKSTNVLDCYPGLLPNNQASVIPTTTTEAPATTERGFSLEARVHMFLLDLIGESNAYESSVKPTVPNDVEETWIAEALTMQPDFVIPEYEYPFRLEYKRPEKIDGEWQIVETHPVEKSVEKEWLKLHFEHGVPLPPYVGIAWDDEESKNLILTTAGERKMSILEVFDEMLRLGIIKRKLPDGTTTPNPTTESPIEP